MEYNFLNPAFFMGLIGGGIPWSILFYGKYPTMRYALYFQAACLGVAALNLFYGLYVISS